jgi:hypothetical protein
VRGSQSPYESSRPRVQGPGRQRHGRGLGNGVIAADALNFLSWWATWVYFCLHATILSRGGDQIISSHVFIRADLNHCEESSQRWSKKTYHPSYFLFAFVTREKMKTAKCIQIACSPMLFASRRKRLHHGHFVLPRNSHNGSSQLKRHGTPQRLVRISGIV